MDPVLYRGYLIHLWSESSGWSFRAHPATADLPILSRQAFRFFATRDAALEAAKIHIDELLGTSWYPMRTV